MKLIRAATLSGYASSTCKIIWGFPISSVEWLKDIFLDMTPSCAFNYELYFVQW